MMIRHLFFLIVSVMFFPFSIFASNTQEMTLPNGLKVIVREDHRAPIVLNSIWYKVGASYEMNGKTGISHMLEHMMFKGSEKFPDGSFTRLMNDLGGDDNANTTPDYTVYYQTISKNQLQQCFELEADRMNHALFDDSLFQKERQVVEEERRLRVDDNPKGLTWERFHAAAYVNSPYHHPVIGWMTDIEHYTLNDVKKWYYTWYVPNNAVIVVIGDVDAKTVFEMAKQYFEPIPFSIVPSEKPRQEVSAIGEKEIYVNIPAKLPWLVMGYQVPTLATEPNKNEAYALLLCAQILAGGDSARFGSDLVRRRKIALSADAGYDRYDLHQSLFVIAGVPSPKLSTEILKSAIVDEIDRLKKALVTTDELNHAKTQLITNTIYKQDSLLKQAFELGEPEMIGLSWRESDQFAAHVRAVTPAEIQAVARKYFTENNLTTAILVPKVESVTDNR